MQKQPSHDDTPVRARLPLHALSALALGAALALSACGRHDDGATTTGSSAGGSPTTSSGTTAGGSGTSGGSSTSSTASTSGSTSGGSPAPGTASTTAAADNADLNTMPPTGAGKSNSGSGASADASAGGPLAAEDRKFVMDAAAGGMFEVQVSKLAADKATDPAVKQFAQMLVTDHTNANDELKAFASAHSVTLPTTLPKEQQSQLDKLQKASGKDFDKQYAQMVGMKDHKDDISKFEKASQDVKNPDLKAWVDKTLPTLKEHLAAAQKLPANSGKG